MIQETIKKQDEEFEKEFGDYEITIQDNDFIHSEPKELIKAYLHHRDRVIILAVREEIIDNIENYYRQENLADYKLIISDIKNLILDGK